MLNQFKPKEVFEKAFTGSNKLDTINGIPNQLSIHQIELGSDVVLLSNDTIGTIFHIFSSNSNTPTILKPGARMRIAKDAEMRYNIISQDNTMVISDTSINML